MTSPKICINPWQSEGSTCTFRQGVATCEGFVHLCYGMKQARVKKLGKLVYIVQKEVSFIMVTIWFMS